MGDGGWGRGLLKTAHGGLGVEYDACFTELSLSSSKHKFYDIISMKSQLKQQCIDIFVFKMAKRGSAEIFYKVKYSNSHYKVWFV